MLCSVQYSITTMRHFKNVRTNSTWRVPLSGTVFIVKFTEYIQKNI